MSLFLLVLKCNCRLGGQLAPKDFLEIFNQNFFCHLYREPASQLKARQSKDIHFGRILWPCMIEWLNWVVDSEARLCDSVAWSRLSACA